MKNSDYSLPKLVFAFLEKGKEGECWDFKQEWHENISDLIKDIICFANTVHDEDCYLIFGIDDNLQVTGMKKERRKQADILDALSQLAFAGDAVPQISVDTIAYDGEILDVLTVYNTELTPVYLKKPYGKMCAGCIYLRNGDRNTPDKGNAELYQIENLWKKRFGLTKPPLEYVFDRLSSKLEWKESGEYFYNIYKPELVMHLYHDEDTPRNTDEYYVYTQTNEHCSFGIIDIIASGTILYSRQVIWLDSGRLCVPVPEWGFIKKDHSGMDSIRYKYYVNGSKIHKLQQFLYDSKNTEHRWAYGFLMKAVLMFESDEEHIHFEEYASRRTEHLKKTVEADDSYDYISTGDDAKTARYINDLRYGKALNELLTEMRSFENESVTTN